MMREKSLEQQINTILAQWNPIGVPEFIAEDEYRLYVEQIIAVGQSVKDMKLFLLDLIENVIGLGFDQSRLDQCQEIERVAVRITRLLQK